METLNHRDDLLSFNPTSKTVKTVSFSNDKEDQALLRKFTQFGRDHYEGHPNFVPLLDAEHLGSTLLGMIGYFEKKNFFYEHGEARFFLAYKDGKIAGRLVAFVNDDHEKHWKDGVGFFGHFECIEDEDVARDLLEHASAWLRARGKTIIRGPQNFPINESTPGFMVEGFESRPIVYYHYNHPYYADFMRSLGYREREGVRSWEISFPDNQIEEKLGPLAKRIVEKNGIEFEHWGERSIKIRKQEMFEIYNDAWSDNFGFVPFTRKEFDKIVDDMVLILDKKLFVFAYVDGEAAAFFGAVPNIFESLAPRKGFDPEAFRVARLLLQRKSHQGVRTGYLGVKRQFRKIGLDAVLIWKQNQYAIDRGYHYSDMGWVLESNPLMVRMIERFGGRPSKRYVVFEKSLAVPGESRPAMEKGAPGKPGNAPSLNQ